MKNLENNDMLALTMYHYAYLNENDVVEMVVSLPSVIQDRQYISIPTADQSLVGKKYNRETGEFEDVMYYYAVLDDKDIVLDVVALPAPVTEPKKISVATYDKSIVGLWYNRVTGAFEAVPIHVLAKMNTGEINTIKTDGSGEDKWLQTELNEIRDELKNVAYGNFGGYKTSFGIEENIQTTAEYAQGDGKQYDFHFDTGLPGYYPKMIKLVGSDKKKLIAEIYVVRNGDGTIKHRYMDKSYIGSAFTNDDNELKLRVEAGLRIDNSAFEAYTDSSSLLHDTGAGSFVQDLTGIKNGSAEINDITYNQDTFSFKLRVSDGIAGKCFTSMDLRAYVY